jgi:hypothetical protein
MKYAPSSTTVASFSDRDMWRPQQCSLPRDEGDHVPNSIEERPKRRRKLQFEPPECNVDAHGHGE